jgi:hypothetical protein
VIATKYQPVHDRLVNLTPPASDILRHLARVPDMGSRLKRIILVMSSASQKRNDRNPTVRSITNIATKVRKILSDAIAAAVGSKLKRR